MALTFLTARVFLSLRRHDSCHTHYPGVDIIGSVSGFAVQMLQEVVATSAVQVFVIFKV
jgi:hypothetical protein